MRRGFSLVELSIVLVILGLLTGGILAGQSLIRAAELRAAVTEYHRYATAVMSFRQKYFMLPGDINNATRFWTAAATCPPTYAAPLTGNATCNGTGNGFVGETTGDRYERFLVWHHLTNAGLVEGNYTGATGPDGSKDSVQGVNIPSSRVSQGAWSFYNASSSYNILSDNHAFFFGKDQAGNFMNDDPVITPEEAWNMDTKLDDGKPNTGMVIGRPITTCANSSDPNDASATYLLSSTGITCVLAIVAR